jgi:hypothetical protein
LMTTMGQVILISYLFQFLLVGLNLYVRDKDKEEEKQENRDKRDVTKVIDSIFSVLNLRAYE